MEEKKNKFLIKSYKQMFMVIAVFTLMIFVGGTTYAFFNYTRTDSANTVRVGRIYFNHTQDGKINLTNAFPITVTKDANGHITNGTGFDTVEINIEGDTDYVDGVEYLVSSTNTNITTSNGTLVPISLDITATNLGTENANYFTARESKDTTMYKKLVGGTLVGDQMLLVGYIKPNTTSGTIEGIQNGKLTIKAYLDDNNILISDTYDGTESDNMGTPNSLAQGKTVLTTEEWNNFTSNGVSFQIKVEANEGIWVKDTLDNIIRTKNINTTTNRPIMDNEQSDFVTASTGINFGAVSSDTNGKGVYMRAGTENDAYPILYYRGAVEDNNVIFNNKCWKGVRTTDTGGVKLIYNGLPNVSSNNTSLLKSEYTLVTNTGNFIYDETDNTWTRTIIESDGSRGSQLEISFKVPARDNYIMLITGTTSTSGEAGMTIYKDTSAVNGTGNGGGGALNLSYTYGTLTTDNVIKMTYYGNGTTDSPTIIKVKMVYLGYECNNLGIDSLIKVSDKYRVAYNTSDKSLAYAGYMYGDVYMNNPTKSFGAIYFGSGFDYVDGLYKLTDAKLGLDDTHHYTCNLTSSDGTCETINYYYHFSIHSNEYYYVNLTGGEGIDSAIEKMQTNTTDSNAKTQIDAWYAGNMNNVTNKLEDTIWCNDRSMGNGNNNGRIATGGNLTTELYYGAYQRSNYASNTSTVKNQPSLACTNKNDAFTVNNQKGNQALTYPIAMLTSDEMVLAGGLTYEESTFYLYNDEDFWTMSPYKVSVQYDMHFKADYNGRIGDNYVNSENNGIRPAISIKPGLPVVSGTGTVNDPYVIE